MSKRITILGSTGSIGTSTLDLVAMRPDSFEIHALIAGRNVDLLARQALAHRPKIVGISDAALAPQLQSALVNTGITVIAGQAECDQIAGDPVDLVVAGIVGLAGLPSVMKAAEAGNRIALANKESLVSAGQLVCETAAKHNARLLPLDSEHSAIFQCWTGWQSHQDDVAGDQDLRDISHICLTASGGPFRERPLEEFSGITPAEAVKHPNWSMGQKISVDSATMMNKGLEVIEAAWLFGMDQSQIEVVIHPQVAIHGLVYFNDGSIISQLGTADMKTPISYALAWPERLDWRPETLSLTQLGRFDFWEVDAARYPCFYLARQALVEGGAKPAVLNAANEIAVAAFLDNQIQFTQIAEIVSATLDHDFNGNVSDLATVLDLDHNARAIAKRLIAATNG